MGLTCEKMNNDPEVLATNYLQPNKNKLEMVLLVCVCVIQGRSFNRNSFTPSYEL